MYELHGAKCCISFVLVTRHRYNFCQFNHGINTAQALATSTLTHNQWWLSLDSPGLYPDTNHCLMTACSQVETVVHVSQVLVNVFFVF